MNKTTKTTFIFSTIAILSITMFSISKVLSHDNGNNKHENENVTISLEDAIKHDVKMKNIGDTCTIKATVLPENASDKRLNWSLSEGYNDKLSFTVSEDTGSITIKKLATFESYYTLTAVSLDNKDVKATCKIYSFNDIESISFTKFSFEGEDIDNTRLEINKQYQLYLNVNANSDNNRTLDIPLNQYAFRLSNNLSNILTIGNAGPDLGNTPVMSITPKDGHIEFVLASITFNKQAFDVLKSKTVTGSIFINDIECSITIGAYVKVSSIVLDSNSIKV